MSTDGSTQPDPTTPPTAGASAAGTDPTGAPAVSSSEGTLADVEPTDTGQGFVGRHTNTLIALMVAVIVAALAIAGVAVYRHHVAEQNSATEAAFSTTVEEQGATLETIECSGDTCAAIIQGQAYTVLVQEDGKGEQHFGVVAYTGD